MTTGLCGGGSLWRRAFRGQGPFGVGELPMSCLGMEGYRRPYCIALRHCGLRRLKCLQRHFGIYSTVYNCRRIRASHHMGPDHTRPCSVHCERIWTSSWLCVCAWSRMSVLAANHTGANLSRKARVGIVRPGRSQPCTDDKESVCVLRAC